MQSKIKLAVRDVHNFPKPGIVFKDITPILTDPELCKEIVDSLFNQLKDLDIDVVAGIESRGFLFGPIIAQKLGVGFVPIRKSGKLPYITIQESYDLEYGTAVIECHQDAIMKKQNVLIHDDLLATGGTALAASRLIQKLSARLAGFSFLISLDSLGGREKLSSLSDHVFSLADY